MVVGIVDDHDFTVSIMKVFDFSGEVVIGRFVDVVWCVCHTYIVQCAAGKARDARDFSDILLKKTPPHDVLS